MPQWQDPIESWSSDARPTWPCRADHQDNPFSSGEKVLLDEDLAILYGVETRNLVQAVKRNLERFPEDFMFQLTPAEWEALRSQTGISKEGRGGRR